jgi:hypothetical protein
VASSGTPCMRPSKLRRVGTGDMSVHDGRAGERKNRTRAGTTTALRGQRPGKPRWVGQNSHAERVRTCSVAPHRWYRRREETKVSPHPLYLRSLPPPEYEVVKGPSRPRLVKVRRQPLSEMTQGDVVRTTRCSHRHVRGR